MVEYLPLQKEGSATYCISKEWRKWAVTSPRDMRCPKEEFSSGDQNVPCHVTENLEIIILELFLKSLQCFLQFSCSSQQLKGGGGRWWRGGGRQRRNQKKSQKRGKRGEKETGVVLWSYVICSRGWVSQSLWGRESEASQGNSDSCVKRERKWEGRE